jgi:hypothetical protein
VRKSRKLALTVTGLLASAMMTGCTPGGDVIDADYAQICKDNRNETRVEDNHCSQEGRSGGYYGWYFYQSGSTVPGVGSPARGGVTSIPGGTTAKSGTPSKGGTVSRGGFGNSAKGSSGG